MTCGTCWHGVEIGNKQIVCRRNPPVADPSYFVATDGDRRPGVWPVIGDEESCGEYKRNLNKAPDAPTDF